MTEEIQEPSEYQLILQERPNYKDMYSLDLVKEFLKTAYDGPDDDYLHNKAKLHAIKDWLNFRDFDDNVIGYLFILKEKYCAIEAENYERADFLLDVQNELERIIYPDKGNEFYVIFEDFMDDYFGETIESTAVLYENMLIKMRRFFTTKLFSNGKFHYEVITNVLKERLNTAFPEFNTYFYNRDDETRKRHELKLSRLRYERLKDQNK